MAHSMDTLRTPFEASRFGLSIRRGNKRSQFSCLNSSGGPQISVSLDWSSGWDSSLANSDRDQNRLTVSYYLVQLEH
jgi:hypothetical protein